MRARWKAKNSPLRRARAASELSSSRLCLTNQPAAFSFVERDARIMRSNCSRGRDGREGERQPLHHVFWSLPQRVSAARRVFSGEKEVSGPCPAAALCEQRAAVCTTTEFLGSCLAWSSRAKGSQEDKARVLLPPGMAQGGGWPR